MLPFERCPVCTTGRIVQQEVNHKIKGSGKVVVLKVCAYVCVECKGLFYSLDSVKKFEKIKGQLESSP